MKRGRCFLAPFLGEMHNHPALVAFDPAWSRRVGRPQALNNAVAVAESSGSHARVSVVQSTDLRDGDDVALIWWFDAARLGCIPVQR